MGEAPDTREQADCLDPLDCDWSCDQHVPGEVSSSTRAATTAYPLDGSEVSTAANVDSTDDSVWEARTVKIPPLTAESADNGPVDGVKNIGSKGGSPFDVDRRSQALSQAVKAVADSQAHYQEILPLAEQLAAFLADGSVPEQPLEREVQRLKAEVLELKRQNSRLSVENTRLLHINQEMYEQRDTDLPPEEMPKPEEETPTTPLTAEARALRKGQQRMR